MNQNMGQLIRYILIIQKLSGKKKFIPAEELISYLNLQMELRGYDVGLSVRTLQRDIADIESMFDIEIKNRRGEGYFIACRTDDTDLRYEELLLNFDLLTYINNSADVSEFIIPEHHRPKGAESIPALIHAIKTSNVVKFDYKLIRRENRLISKTSLRKRVGQLLRFGAGSAVGHWGGRYLWQLADSDKLLIAWKLTPGSNPRTIEAQMIEDFVKLHGKRPFANLIN